MFYLFGNVNFLPSGYVPWQSAFNILAHYVFLHEPTTQTYYFGIPWDSAFDPPSTSLMFSFQAYPDREALYSTHFNSPAMKTFLEAASPHMATDLDLSHWTHVAGFIDADDKLGKNWEEREERECGVMYDVKIVCKKGMRGVVKERLARLAERVEDDGSKGVLTWMVFEGLDTKTELRIFGRYVDRDYMEALRAREEMVEFWGESKGEIERIEQRGYVPNGKGWLHR